MAMSEPVAHRDGFRRRRKGQSLVEFAFVASAFMLLVMATVDFGRGILFYNMLSNAVREGARYGVISANTTANICSVVIGAMQAPGSSGCNSTSSDLNIVVCQGQSVTDSGIQGSGLDSTKESGTAVTVVATYRFKLITPFLANFVGSTSTPTYHNCPASQVTVSGTDRAVTLTAKSTMYNENWIPQPTPTPAP